VLYLGYLERKEKYDLMRGERKWYYISGAAYRLVRPVGSGGVASGPERKGKVSN
jgi:hypothetical protein